MEKGDTCSHYCQGGGGGVSLFICNEGERVEITDKEEDPQEILSKMDAVLTEKSLMR